MIRYGGISAFTVTDVEADNTMTSGRMRVFSRRNR